MLKSKGRNRASILFLLLFCATPLFGQDAAKPARLFDRDDTLNVTLTAPWGKIERDEKNQEPYPAKNRVHRRTWEQYDARHDGSAARPYPAEGV